MSGETRLSPIAEAPGLIVRERAPIQLESTLDALGASTVTPVQHFFVRSHGDTPVIDPAAWRLELSGCVRHPLRFALDDLLELSVRHVPVTLECAGNGRSFFQPSTPGLPWELGAVGTALWSGVRLRDLLGAAEPLDDATHVWFEGAERKPDGEPLFVRSLPLVQAGDVLLAFAMNHRPLTPAHGAPLRAIVPGWYAMASVKWLSAIRLERTPATNEYMARAYHYVYDRGGRTYATPVEGMRVKSLIVTPRHGERRRPGALRVAGYAWGARPVRRVDLSADGGRTWSAATLGRPLGEHAWRPWEALVELPPGTHVIMARAIDADGAAQPMTAVRNREGYGWHAVQRVRLSVG